MIILLGVNKKTLEQGFLKLRYHHTKRVKLICQEPFAQNKIILSFSLLVQRKRNKRKDTPSLCVPKNLGIFVTGGPA